MKSPVTSKAKDPIKILIIVPGMIASVTVGVLLPLVELERQGYIQLKLMPSGMMKFLTYRLIKTWCDEVLFCRNSELHDLEYLKCAIRENKKVIYEIDDNFFNIPLSTSIGKYHRMYFRLYVVTMFFKYSNLVRVYSHAMFELANRYTKNVEIKHLYFLSDILRQLPDPKKTDVIKIVYPTTRIDEPDLEDMIYRALHSILKKYGDKVELHLWKKEPPKQLAGLKNIVYHKSSLSYKEYLVDFYSSGYDIGLAPVMDSPFYHSKTNNKYREFGGCKVPAIYTNSLPYASCVQDGYNGFLCDNTFEDWVSKISALVENESLRNTIAANAHDDIIKHYNFNDFVMAWKNDIEKVSNAKLKPQEESANISVSEVLIFGDSEEPSDERVKCLHEVASLLGLFSRYLPIENITADQAYQDKAALFLTDSGKFLSKISSLTSLFKFSILDLSRFKGDSDLLDDLYSKLSQLKVNVISNKNNTLLNTSLADVPIPLKLIDGDVLSLYALNGYHGVYLEYLIKCKIKPVGENKSFLKKLFEINKLYTRSITVMKTVHTYTRWFLGGRVM